jgi:hypothetical protein
VNKRGQSIPAVEQARQVGRPTVTTAVAAALLGTTPARVRRQIDRSLLPGGAEPRPQRARYYVYSDVPPLLPKLGPAHAPSDELISELRARISALETATLLLRASDARLREASEVSARATDLLRQAEVERSAESQLLRLADEAKAAALSALITPGHAGSLG